MNVEGSWKVKLIFSFMGKTQEPLHLEELCLVH
jgi:hypothetical protein